MRLLRSVVVACLLSSCGSLAAASPTSTPARDCRQYVAPDPHVDALIQHLKTSATVVEVTSPCTLRVRIAGGNGGTVAPFNDKVIVLRVTELTTFKTASQGDLAAVGRFGLKAGDVFTLSFDSRPFPDGSFPLNFMNW
jgi:hypothetical protein